MERLRSLDLTGTKATCAHVHRLVSALDNSLDSADIGLPGPVGLAVGVGHVMTEGHALTAHTTFCHFDTSHMHRGADDVIFSFFDRTGRVDLSCFESKNTQIAAQ